MSCALPRTCGTDSRLDRGGGFFSLMSQNPQNYGFALRATLSLSLPYIRKRVRGNRRRSDE